MTNEPTSYPISLAQWSLHRTIRAGELDPLDFAKMTREEWNIGGVEYVNTFFKDKVSDQAYIGELKKRADDHGVKSLLIMIDNEGHMGAVDERELQRGGEVDALLLGGQRAVACARGDEVDRVRWRKGRRRRGRSRRTCAWGRTRRM